MYNDNDKGTQLRQLWGAATDFGSPPICKHRVYNDVHNYCAQLFAVSLYQVCTVHNIVHNDVSLYWEISSAVDNEGGAGGGGGRTGANVVWSIVCVFVYLYMSVFVFLFVFVFVPVSSRCV